MARSISEASHRENIPSDERYLGFGECALRSLLGQYRHAPAGARVRADD
jgi:hypothetical protein